MGRIVLTDAEPEVEVLHPYREQGRDAGKASAKDDETVLAECLGASLDCLLDDAQPAAVKEKSFEYVQGFAEGWAEMMAVKPLQFLTRQQTDRVANLPRRIRRAWMSEYERGKRRWVRSGGALSGKRPVLPEIP